MTRCVASQRGLFRHTLQHPGTFLSVVRSRPFPRVDGALRMAWRGTILGQSCELLLRTSKVPTRPHWDFLAERKILHFFVENNQLAACIEILQHEAGRLSHELSRLQQSRTMVRASDQSDMMAPHSSSSRGKVRTDPGARLFFAHLIFLSLWSLGAGAGS